MLSLASPLWLSALLLIPVVWWLHRFRERGRRFPVAALFLWDAAREDGSVGELAQRPESVWLLRAALVALLVLALAGPQWTVEESARVVLWIDDSVSMRSLDGNGASRLQRGWEKARLELAARQTAGIELRSLGSPGVVEVLDSQALPGDLPATWLEQAPAEPGPPLPLQMDPDAEHWLLSDGNSVGLPDWVRRAPLTRVIQVDGSRANVGITGLSLRRFPEDREQGWVMLSVKNSGSEAAERTLELYVGEQPLLQERIPLDPGEEASRQVELAEAHRGALRARLSPADALGLDDELELDSAAVAPRFVNISGDCGPYLPAALSTHPWLSTRSTDSTASLRIHCGGDPGEESSAAIVVLLDDPSRPVQGVARWHPAAGKLAGLALSAGSLSAHRGVADVPGAQPLLSASGQTLISHEPARRRLTVALDLAEPSLARLPEYPLLILGLVDTVLAQDLSSGAVSLQVPPQLIDIEPTTLPQPGPKAGRELAPGRQNLSFALAGGALLLLALDVLRLLWRRSRQSRQIHRWQLRHER